MSLRIEMLNRALLRIGANPLVNEQDPAAPQHLAVYDSVLERMASHPFSFFKAVRRLARLTERPSPSHFAYAFQLPADRVAAPRAVYADERMRQPVTDYDIEGDRLLCGYEQIWLAYAVLRGPERWPGDFRECFTTALMAELALSVREDRSLHDRMWVKAFGSPGQNGIGGLFALALENDSQATPSTMVGGGVNPLVDVR